MTYDKGKPTPRGWLQFSMTALLVATTIFAILFAWWRDRSQLLRRLEVEVERAAMVRDKAMEAEAMARNSEQMARQRANEMQAALRAATIQPTPSQEIGENG